MGLIVSTCRYCQGVCQGVGSRDGRGLGTEHQDVWLQFVAVAKGCERIIIIVPIALRGLICRLGKLGLPIFLRESTLFQKWVGPIFLEGRPFLEGRKRDNIAVENQSRLARKKPLSEKKIRQRLLKNRTKVFSFVYKGFSPTVWLRLKALETRD